MNKRWVFQQQPPKRVVANLCGELNINPILATLLAQRGIEDYNSARDFFRPDIKQLHDPFLMKDMDAAVERLTLAISNNEKILIYGDYDVDGTTAVALLINTLKSFHDRMEFYIPDRYKEGYGISKDGIDWALAHDFTLVIALDCGIKSIELVAYARRAKIDFIICDHHKPGEMLPEAVAVLDPKRVDCDYPFKELSGCGIGFKLVQGFCQQQGIDEETVFAHLDLVAVSIAADIVPIVDENRILAYLGLKKINASPSKGIAAILKQAEYEKEVTISDLVFIVGPRINSAGRIDHGSLAVELLTAKEEEFANDSACKITKTNQTRRNVDERITEDALAMLSDDPTHLQTNTTVLYHPEWHKGVIGIVASRCIEYYHRPTIILTRSGDLAVGSARSIPGFNIYNAINACSKHLKQFGGHNFAAGLTIEIDKIPEFKADFERYASKHLSADDRVPVVEIDLEIDLDWVNPKFMRILDQMEPFGPGNLRPVFWTRNCYAKNEPRILKDKHLKLFAGQMNNRQAFDAIGFGMGAYLDLIKENKTFDMAFTLSINEYRGNKTIQLIIKDIKLPQN
jgi:single-stranded-DNA-specific exonuclease